MRFIVKFSHKSLPELFSYRTFAPLIRKERPRGGEKPQEAAIVKAKPAEDRKRVYTCTDMLQVAIAAKQAEK